MAGDQGLSIESAQQAGGARGACTPLSRAPRGLLLPCVSPFFEQDKAGRQRDIFQLPLTLFIITNMKGREKRLSV